MDRFIESNIKLDKSKIKDLKSNMDRFIADTYHNNFVQLAFKIQYG